MTATTLGEFITTLTDVVGFVIDTATSVVNFIMANPILLIPASLFIVGAVFGLVKSLTH